MTKNVVNFHAAICLSEIFIPLKALNTSSFHIYSISGDTSEGLIYVVGQTQEELVDGVITVNISPEVIAHYKARYELSESGRELYLHVVAAQLKEHSSILGESFKSNYLSDTFYDNDELTHIVEQYMLPKSEKVSVLN